jgi:mannose-1-phosphate guanylyltransferase
MPQHQTPKYLNLVRYLTSLMEDTARPWKVRMMACARIVAICERADRARVRMQIRETEARMREIDAMEPDAQAAAILADRDAVDALEEEDDDTDDAIRVQAIFDALREYRRVNG